MVLIHIKTLLYMYKKTKNSTIKLQNSRYQNIQTRVTRVIYNIQSCGKKSEQGTSSSPTDRTVNPTGSARLPLPQEVVEENPKTLNIYS